MKEMKNLIPHLNGPLLTRCSLFYSEWYLENNDDTVNNLTTIRTLLKKEVDNLYNSSPSQKMTKISRKRSTSIRPSSTYIENFELTLPGQILLELTSNVPRVQILRKWAEINFSLASLLKNEKLTFYISGKHGNSLIRSDSFVNISKKPPPTTATPFPSSQSDNKLSSKINSSDEPHSTSNTIHFTNINSNNNSNNNGNINDNNNNNNITINTTINTTINNSNGSNGSNYMFLNIPTTSSETISASMKNSNSKQAINRRETNSDESTKDKAMQNERRKKVISEYSSVAISALAQCCKEGASFPDVVQLLNLVFEQDDLIISKETNAKNLETIKALPEKLLVRAAPQILIQLNHPNPDTASFLHSLVLDLMKKHYNAITFSLIVLSSSHNSSRASAATRILNEFKAIEKKVFGEFELVRKALLRSAVTWHEKADIDINLALEHNLAGRTKDMLLCLKKFSTRCNNPKCMMQQAFVDQYKSAIDELTPLLNVALRSLKEDPTSLNNRDDSNLTKVKPHSTFKQNPAPIPSITSNKSNLVDSNILSTLNPSNLSTTSSTTDDVFAPQKPISTAQSNALLFFKPANNTTNNITNNLNNDNVFNTNDNTNNNAGGRRLGMKDRRKTMARIGGENENGINKTTLANLKKWMETMATNLQGDISKIKIIQLASISPELCQKKHFLIAVPGTYKVGKKINPISYFVGQLRVYDSKQCPKDVVIKGEDGSFYQYLLKGHEDLRMDERVMNFFKLVNSILKKEDRFHSHLLQTMEVIPLSLSHGLVQWVPGTDTLTKVIENYRELHKRPTRIELDLAKQFTPNGFGNLPGLQRMQIICKIFNQIPDTDLANFFWLKGTSAEQWNLQIKTFAISNALNSIIGYVLGLGDRHPSNLLIDRITGKVVHIDFGDCFEKAMKRDQLPEKVPFRLTRMMTRAMGVNREKGLFKTTFVEMTKILRENRRVLLMFLDVFVHEPLIDVEEEENKIHKKGNKNDISEEILKRMKASIEKRNRVKQKLTGTDFEAGIVLSVEDQAKRLIESAKDIYNLSRMFIGWGPFW